MKKSLIKLIRPLVKSLLDEMLAEMLSDEPDLINDLKLSQHRKGKKLKVWDALLMDMSELCICVRYFDHHGIEDFRVHKCEPTMLSLKNAIVNFQPYRDKISEVSIHVRLKNSSATIIETIISTNHYYTSDQLPQIFQPVLDWMQKYPELII